MNRAELHVPVSYKNNTDIIRTLNIFYGFKIRKRSASDGRVVNDLFEHVQ